MNTEPKKRRILDEIRLNAIAAVDRPAQEGAEAVILKRADDAFDDMLAGLNKPKPKRQILRDFCLVEVSAVTKPAQPTARATILKNHSQGMSEGIRKAIEAIHAALDDQTAQVQRLSYSAGSASFDAAIAKLSPKRENAAQDELGRLAEQHSDRTGLSLYDAYNVVLKQHPDLAEQAINGRH